MMIKKIRLTVGVPMYQGYGHIRDEPILWFTTWRATNSKIQYFENEKGHRTVFFFKKKTSCRIQKCNILADSKINILKKKKCLPSNMADSTIEYIKR